MSKIFGAKVKNVLSGDTLVLTPLNNSKQERILSLAYIQAPRLSSNEKYSFESRELLRSLLIGKEVKFWVLYKNQSDREFGDISTPLFQSLSEYVLSKGGAKVRDNADEDETYELKQAELKAQLNDVGLWNSKSSTSIEVQNGNLTQDQIENSQLPDQAYQTIVEKVISGDRLLCRIFLSERLHAVVPILIAGIRCPRTSNGSEPSEPFGDEAKEYIESRLLARSIKLVILGESSNGVAVAKILHPAGNISEKIIEDGFADVNDWQSPLIGAAGMSILRRKEKEAKLSGKGMWKSSTPKSAAAPKSASSSTTNESIEIGKTLQGTVARIISSDTLVLRLKSDKEITVQLTSLRAPRQSDAASAIFVPVAREFVRSKIIGKHVKFTIDAIRPKSDNFEERPLVTVSLLNNTPSELPSINETIVANGYATVIRHRRGDEDRSPDWDHLIELEQAATKSKKGIFGNAPKSERIVDASENAARAKPYITTFEHRSKIPAVVEHISSASRFRLNLPKEGVKLTLVLGGLANPKDRESKLMQEALALTNKQFYQRDVFIDVYGGDKVGGFIGNIYLQGQNVPHQVNLVQRGYFELHDRSIDQTKFASRLLEAESQAKESKSGIWVNYDPSLEEANLEDLSISENKKQQEPVKLLKNYYDISITDISKEGLISFHVENADKLKLKSMMKEFHEFYANPIKFKKLTKNPKIGDLVSAKFSESGKFYRAKITEIDRLNHKFKVQHIDYGNSEFVSLDNLRELSTEFNLNRLPAQAVTAQLSLISLPPANLEEYLDEAIYFLDDLTIDKQLIACENFKNPAPGIDMDITLYDPSKISKDATYSINKELVENGWAIVKKNKFKNFELAMKQDLDSLLALEKSAKKSHKGCWEYGDIEDVEE
ncbi:hypothetical protein B5S29_g2662 [[Candida] boidinii]|nr:hypothetical protein B5S29_g2662 [[Candida] boidinii]